MWDLGEREPEKYKDYFNRTHNKLLNRAKELKANIGYSSLKPSDKNKLITEILELFKNKIS